MTRAWKVLAGSVALVVLAACGGTPFPSEDLGVGAPTVRVDAAHLASALRATTAARTAKIAMNVELTGLGPAGSLTETGDGVLDLANHAMDFSVHVKGGRVSATMEMRLVEGALYLRIAGVPGATDRWSKVSATDLGGSKSPLGTSSDPSQLLQTLHGLGADATVVGHEKVRGAPTTRYHATIDLLKAADTKGLSPNEHDALHKLLDGLAGSLTKVPTDIWVDAQGRLRKMQMQIDFGSMFGGAPENSPRMVMTMELYDYGTPVRVEAPPADQLAPFNPNLLGASSTQPA
jgi:hypothetical protein